MPPRSEPTHRSTDPVPSPAARTTRLDLTPLRPADAEEMVPVLADPRLYTFISGTPPTVVELRRQYRRWAIGHSPDREEEWVNWVVRRRPESRAVGSVQATVVDHGRRADVAWVIGLEHQGQGYASEAASALVNWLESRGVRTVTAHIHPDHVASAAVAAHAGLDPTHTSEDGERVWRRLAAED